MKLFKQPYLIKVVHSSSVLIVIFFLSKQRKMGINHH